MIKIGNVLAGASFAAHRQESRRLLDLQNTVRQALSAFGFDINCRVKTIIRGELILVVKSGGEAARLRQILPTLTAALQKNRFHRHVRPLRYSTLISFIAAYFGAQFIKQQGCNVPLSVQRNHIVAAAVIISHKDFRPVVFAFLRG